jgi:hypothetical protein
MRAMDHEREPAAIAQILDVQADVMVAMGLTTARDRAMHGVHVAVVTARRLPELPGGVSGLDLLGMFDGDDAATMQTGFKPTEHPALGRLEMRLIMELNGMNDDCRCVLDDGDG